MVVVGDVRPRSPAAAGEEDAWCMDCPHHPHYWKQCPAWYPEENAPVCGCDGFPFVSAIIPMRNEEAYIGRCLDSILACDYPADRFEILVADGLSEDASAEVAAQYAEGHSNIRVIANPGRIQAAAMNVGIAQAQGGVVIRMDAHATYPPNYIRMCVDRLVTTGAANVGGRPVPVGEGRFGEAVAAAMASPFGVGDARFRHAAHPCEAESVFLGAWRRETLEAVGGFHEDWAGNEDYEVNIRLRQRGGKILYDPAIQYRYAVRKSLGALWRQYRTHGYYKSRTMLAYPREIRRRQLAPPVLVAALPVALPLYLAGLAAASVITARRRGWRLLPVLPVVFAAMHIGWGVGFWQGLARWGWMAGCCSRGR